MIKLRKYQENAVSDIRTAFAKGKKRVVLSLTTGGGKTVIFTEITRLTIEKGGSVLVITDRKELLTQTGSTFENFGLKPEYLTAKKKHIEKGGLYVAMSETLKRRITKPDYVEFIQSFGLIIIDEVHKRSFDKLYESTSPFQYIIGVTATPYRNGRATPPLSLYYDLLVQGIQTSELIGQGYLAPAESFAAPTDFSNVKLKAGEFDSADLKRHYDEVDLYTGVVENYKKHAAKTKALLFSANVATSLKMCQTLVNAGISAKHIDATSNDRTEILKEFERGDFSILCNVGILTTGYDCPSIETIILYRATMSLPLFLQMCGRGSRIYPKKESFKILDFGGNLKRHGFWQEDRTWSLENATKSKKQGDAPIKECPDCELLLPANARICPECGHEFKQKTKERVFAMLEKMSPTAVKSFARGQATLDELFAIQELKGYHIYWIPRQLNNIEQLKEFAKRISPSKYKGWLWFNARKFGFDYGK